MSTDEMIGETRITGRGQISLPARGLKALAWRKGDRLLVGRLGNDALLLMRRPTNWADAFAGKLTHVFGDTESTVALIRTERATWDDD